MSIVETRDAKEYKLTDAVIRICPACGVVNPSGPSGGCPHLQLVRFDGVEESLEELLSAVAVARREYSSLVSQLKRTVMAHVQDGDGVVETPHRVKASEVDALYSNAGKSDAFNLTHPEISPSRQKSISKKRKPKSSKPKSSALEVDSRQLDLLAHSLPKGDA